MGKKAFLAVLALSACTPAISEKAQTTARINYDLGVASFERGQPRDALRALLAAVEADPDLPEAHNALGLVLHALGKQREALAHYRVALRLRPKFSEASNNMGTLLLDMGQYEPAIAAFDAALGDILYPTPYLAEGNLGWAYYLQGDVVRAREHIGNAVASHPRFCRGYEWLARIALEQDKAADIVANGQRFMRHCLDDSTVASSIAPDYVREMQYYLAMGHLKQGHRSLAREFLAQCAVQDPDAAGYAAKCAQSLRALR